MCLALFGIGAMERTHPERRRPMTRTLVATALFFVLAGPAWAAGPTEPASDSANLAIAATTVSAARALNSTPLPRTPAEAAAVLNDVGVLPESTNSGSPCALGMGPCGSGSIRPSALPMLYVGSALLNGFDVYSTLRGISSGAHEANPLMRSAVAHPAAFIALKAASTALPIMAAEQLWKNNHRVAAVAAMIATNGFMSWVAVHNASVLHQVAR
jgi:hypothetical protein